MMYGIIWRIARPPIVPAMYGWMTDCKLLARRVKTTTGLAVRPPLTDVDVHRRRCLIDTRNPINCGLTLNRASSCKMLALGFNARSDWPLSTSTLERDRLRGLQNEVPISILQRYNFLFLFFSIIMIIWRIKKDETIMEILGIDLWGNCEIDSEHCKTRFHFQFYNGIISFFFSFRLLWTSEELRRMEQLWKF